MIQRFEDMITRTDDPRIKKMFWYFVKDEKWHERLLEYGVKQIFNPNPS